MLRNLLLLLESTPSGQVAGKVTCEIASSQGHCNITALEIRGGQREAGKEDGGTSPHSLYLDDVLDQGPVDTTCADANPGAVEYFANLKIPYHKKVLSGPKYAMLCQEAEAHDLTIIGRDGNFSEHWAHDAKEIINLMLEYRPRPLLITPPELKTERDVLITYDGSPGSSRAIQFFVLMGLTQNRSIHVLSINRKKQVAKAQVDAITTYLKNHHIGTMPHAIDSRVEPRDIIVEKIKETRSSLVVAGAYGASSWKRSIFGSVSDYLIRYCPVPLFTCQ